MKDERIAVAILGITAALLFLALLFAPAPKAQAGFLTIKDRDYQVAVAPTQHGGDALYIHDMRTGLMAILAWDVNTRSLQVRARVPMADLFPPLR